MKYLLIIFSFLFSGFCFQMLKNWGAYRHRSWNCCERKWRTNLRYIREFTSRALSLGWPWRGFLSHWRKRHREGNLFYFAYIRHKTSNYWFKFRSFTPSKDTSPWMIAMPIERLLLHLTQKHSVFARSKLSARHSMYFLWVLKVHQTIYRPHRLRAPCWRATVRPTATKHSLGGNRNRFCLQQQHLRKQNSGAQKWRIILNALIGNASNQSAMKIIIFRSFSKSRTVFV